MKVVGALSGTSVDGIDVVIADINGGGKDRIIIQQIAFETVPWKEEDRKQILQLASNKGTVKDVCLANFMVGEVFANAILSSLEKYGISPQDIQLIGSHGQTIWHESDGAQVKGTLQIGESAVIAEKTGITTVSDFRVSDVAAGGNGAPLTSTFDWLILRPDSGSRWRALQNIGGIGNVTFLPPFDSSKTPIAFDTGPGNVFIDFAAQVATNNSSKFDKDGEMARRGNVNRELLQEMQALQYFSISPPKTTGRELFTFDLANRWKERGKELGMSPEDFLATVTELTAWSIADSYKRWSPSEIGEVLVSGGGCRNKYLMERIHALLSETFGYDIKVTDHESIGIDSDAKEGLLFALLGWLCVSGSYGNVPSCTGARHPKVLGKVTPGKNFNSLQFKSG